MKNNLSLSRELLQRRREVLVDHGQLPLPVVDARPQLGVRRAVQRGQSGRAPLVELLQLALDLLAGERARLPEQLAQDLLVLLVVAQSPGIDSSLAFK